jgi:hypothetical protein
MFFFFSCCCLAVAGRRAGGMRNKFFGKAGLGIFPHDDTYEMNLQTRNERYSGVLKGEASTLLKPVLGTRVDTAKVSASKPSRRGGELTFTFGMGPA